MSNHI